MDWYHSHSGAAHGDPTAVDEKEADSAEFWIAHYLAEPILDWLRAHPGDPWEISNTSSRVLRSLRVGRRCLPGSTTNNPPASPPTSDA
jgi:hypothetical protein